ncbi:MAG: bifunctional histidinol-phosphatase/imidazoleglycerol-phosphate dehydratase HisB [Woeseia sp.]|nr:bifunctional histidinol-phosphatase/imidazoleglycerol-phosphate dehydratase HisB [Woeseia sp.]MBT8097449.1 bifunctional histidinol-phosphatase/imidazoleglycerol-phosphate dehydratase HisB [Woeseia sp.]NNE59421.1 bifunctional histidinol-phosphatase/imidazoleglycerol-phosphate dehydratase HisB [Woeseia sp.]NNL53529.1 bifunctional histidinol-phosphatase/imidazoleglycerol-phosphate dehydratase HisB [Woeseia sp.]
MSDAILFIDRDGTLVAEPEDEQIDALAKIRLIPDVIPALLRLAHAGYRFVMVSNQDGLGTATFAQQDFDQCQSHIVQLFASQGIVFDDVLICPHRQEDSCGCRKPRTGLLTKLLAGTDLDRRRSAVIGDRSTDMEFAENIGIRGFRLDPDADWLQSWPGIASTLVDVERTADVRRETRETQVRARANLDTEQPVQIATGIGFLDHMLEQIARHGGFSLQLNCTGDLHIDEHHTVEDIALTLGQAMREALGDKRGISRFGFLLPMDETEAQVSIDLSGRPFFVFDGEFPRADVGGLPTELVPHFFRSLADALGAAIHITVRGENAHHMVEACFKATGRALRRAIRVEGESLPTTKGMLS